MRIVIDVGRPPGLSGSISSFDTEWSPGLVFDGWLDLLRCLEDVLAPLSGSPAHPRPGAE